MIGKAGLAAIVVVSALVAGKSVDLRELYDQMYPVDTLRRDALGLCQQADLTFVRALEDDRVSCYERMPHSLALALGLVQPTSALSRLFAAGGFRDPHPLPETGLASWLALPCAGRGAPAPADPHGTRRALDALAERDAGGTASALAEMGLLPREAKLDPSPAPGPALALDTGDATPGASPRCDAPI